MQNFLIDCQSQNREIENEARLGCDHVGEALLIRWMFRHLNVHSHRLTASENLQLHGVSYNVLIKFQRKIAHTANGSSAKARNHVADLHSNFVGRLVGYHVFNQHTILRFEVECPGQGRSDSSNKKTDLSAMYVSVLLQRGVGVPDHIAGYCETDSFTAAGLRENKRVHADNATIGIN